MHIEVTGVSKRFGAHRALEDVTLDVGDGELVALLGPSGSGKTTLLRVLAGLDAADQGMVRFDGRDVTAASVSERGVGFVFQHYALFRHMTVAENVAFGLRVLPRKRRPSESFITGRVHELLSLIRLEAYADRMPSQLSGGQRQRVALARALAVEPRVLLLDEPFGALDAQVRKELRRWLRRLHEDLSVTTILVTHDQDEALELADRVAILHEGRLHQVGNAADLHESPATPFVAGFMGDVNLLEAEVVAGLACAGGLRIPADFPDGTRVRLALRHADLLLEPDEAGEGVVRRLVDLGDRVEVETRLDGSISLFSRFLRSSDVHARIRPGDRVRVQPVRARAFPVVLA
jgi:sulfate/thiosulfate transport system ATP-binding protein